jgi:biotin carboxylase
MKEKLIIIGASYLQIPLIEKANEMGFETHVFAWEEGAVGKNLAHHFYPISIIEKEKILLIAQTLKPCGVVSIASDLAMHTVNFVALNLGLVGNSLECNDLTTNKYKMRRALLAHNLPCPYFQHCYKNEEPDISKLNFPFIVKPTDRSGSRGVTRVDSSDQLKFALNRAWNDSWIKEAIIEEYIQGREISVEMISWRGEHHYLACTDKVTSGPPYFVELEHHMPADLTKSLEIKVINLTKKALSALNIEYGASHTEIIITKENKLYLVEIGARMGGDHIGTKLVKYSTGYDFVQGAIEIATGQFHALQKNLPSFAGICYLFSKPGLVQNLFWSSPLPADIVEYECLIKQGDTIHSLTNSTNRIGYFIYRSLYGRLQVNIKDVLSIEYEKN